MPVDKEKIINGTPTKVLLNSYKAMKDDYNENTAKAFFNEYSKMNFATILDNVGLIAKEPIYGLPYIKKLLLEDNLPCITRLPEIYEVINDYFSDNFANMSDVQKELYENFLNEFNKYIKDISLVLYVIDSGRLEIYENDILKNINNHTFINILHLMKVSPLTFLVYLPFINKYTNYSHMSESDVYDIIDELKNNDSYNDDFFKMLVCGNKLSESSVYVKLLNELPRNIRKYFDFFVYSDINDIKNSLITKEVKFTPYNKPANAINNIFFDLEDDVINKDNNNDEKEKNDRIERAIVEATSDLLLSEYQLCENTDVKCSGYAIIKRGLTIEEALISIGTEYEFVIESEKESKDDDVNDEEIDSINAEEDEDSDTDNAKKKRADKQAETNDTHTGTQKKAPKSENAAKAIQHKAMDIEVKQKAKGSKLKKLGDDIVGAGKAVLKIPMNVVHSIEDIAKKVDDADDDRKKKYMTEPGFRKKIFKNLKLAILYGGTVYYKMAWLPFVMLIRHFSKQKDVRIRTELIRELETEIKVCREKINDASSAGDNKEKYRLMRIEDRLEAELIRVQTNSKNI